MYNNVTENYGVQQFVDTNFIFFSFVLQELHYIYKCKQKRA